MIKKIQKLALRISCFVFGHGLQMRGPVHDFNGEIYWSEVCGYCGKVLMKGERFMG